MSDEIADHLHGVLCLMYERRKRDWLDEHPDATPADIEQALRLIALELGL